jgi:hypothetical protein
MKMQEYISLKDLKKGEFFKRNTHTEKVYIRGDYVRGEERDDLDKAITIIETIILSRGD